MHMDLVAKKKNRPLCNYLELKSCFKNKNLRKFILFFVAFDSWRLSVSVGIVPNDQFWAIFSAVIVWFEQSFSKQ